MILGSDTFNRVTGTLGVNWTEHGLTNMSCDGSFARIDSSGQAHLATHATTSQRDTYFQCWLRGSDSSNAVGLIWRFQDTSNYYLLRATSGAGTAWGVFRIEGGDPPDQIGSFFGSITAGVWKRVAVRHVGTRIQIYFDQDYDTGTGREGPVFDANDTDAQGQLWSGPCGLSSGSNNATGITNIQWNDFIAFDGAAQTIYVDTTFNGGVAGEGMGTEDRPDLHIDWALNNAGLNRGGKLKFLEAGPITNPTGVIGSQPGQFVIGHADKFSSLAFSYPEYDPENGSVTSQGSPNLIIEGMDGGRTLLQNVSTSRFFFTIRGDARGIVFRGLDEEKSAASSQGFILTATSTTVDHSFSVDKCLHRVKPTTGYVICDIRSLCSHVRTMYSYVTGGTFANVRYFSAEGSSSKINKLDAKFNLSDSIMLNLFSCRGRPVDVGGQWDVDHNTMTMDTATFDPVLLEFEAAEDMLGTAIAQNNIVFLRGTSPGTPTALFALRFGGSPGPFISHHNGFSGSALDFCYGDPGNSNPELWTDKTGDICATGVGSGTETPQFTDLAGTTDWQQTAGRGLNGEGTFTSMVVTNLRPLSPSYVDQADDSTPNLGPLDRGALQSFVPVGGFPIPAQSLPEEDGAGRLLPGECPPDYCLEVHYDPDGLRGGPFTITDELMEMRPLRDSKDYLLRDYRAQDTDLVFSDPRGQLDPRIAGSRLDGQNYFKARVEIVIVDNVLGLRSTVYVGELLTVVAQLGKVTWRLGNLFKRLLDKPLLANDTAHIVTTNGNTLASGNGSGDWISDLQVNPGCRVEEWTFTFLSADQFTVEGSLTGQDGTGSRSTAFTSDSGSIAVAPSFWVGTFQAGYVTKITTVWKASGTVTDVIQALLTDPAGGGLDQSEIDTAAFATFDGNPVNEEILFIEDREVSVLKPLAELGRHIGATMFPLGDGRISIVAFISTLMDRASLPALCHWDDLIDLTTDETPVYNEFTFKFDYDAEDTKEFRRTLSWPTRDDDNPSFEAFGVRLPAPSVIELRGFGAVQDTTVEQIAQQLYNRFAFQNEIFAIKLKAKRYAYSLADFAFVQSLYPARESFVEPVEVRRNFAPSAPIVEIDAVDTENFLQSPGACGFGFYIPTHFADDCWVYF